MPSLLLDPDEFAPSGTEGDEMTLRKLLDSYASLQSQPPEAQQAVLEAYFSPPPLGNGFALGRVPINSCDFSGTNYKVFTPMLCNVA